MLLQHSVMTVTADTKLVLIQKGNQSEYCREEGVIKMTTEGNSPTHRQITYTLGHKHRQSQLYSFSIVYNRTELL